MLAERSKANPTPTLPCLAGEGELPPTTRRKAIMPPSTNATTIPLWKRMLYRRLKFLAWLVAILAILLGGSYLFARSG